MRLQPKTILITTYFFIFGISIGTFMEVALSTEEKNNLIAGFTGQILSGQLTNQQLPDIFLHSVGNNIGILALIALAGATVLGFPAAMAAITYKGVALGFTSALILELFPQKGAFLILLSIIPQNLFIIPALLVAAQQAATLAMLVIKNRKGGIKKSLTNNAGPYFFIQFCLSMIVLLGCVIESFICPILLQLIKWQ